MVEFISSNVSNMIAGIALIISLVSIWLAIKARKDARIQALFSGFQQANQATIEHPSLLKDVHGLDLTDNECRNIAYLSVLMDAFQHENADHSKTTFLDKITSVPENKARWAEMKKVYYGSFDSQFIEKIDNKFKINCKPSANKTNSAYAKKRRG